MEGNIVIYFLLTSATFGLSQGFIGWFFKGQDQPSESKDSGPVPDEPVPFEMQTADEKFLMEAGSDLTELDFCHHRVIMQLQSTCSDLSEEGLAKLAVQLLNCQLEAEERTSYTCTDAMTIAECTKEMDGTMWNAYQIVSNRARAICYSVRQQHFRMKTEYTVNKLVHNTQEQLEAMHRLQMSQEEINKLTGNTMEQLQISQNNLVSQHDHMQASAQQMQRFIASNLQALTQEKALIASGNKDLYEATENIKKKLDDAIGTMQKQEQAQKHNHEAVLEDLAGIQGKAKEVFDKIDDSSKNILKYHKETTKQYEQTIENLEKVNKTIAYVLTSIFNLQEAFDQRLEWISEILGGADNKMEVITIVLSHTLYFLLVAIACTFLQTPMFSRFVLLALVPLNAWSQVRGKQSLSFPAMTFFISAIIIVNWILSRFFNWCSYHKSSAPTSPLSQYSKHMSLVTNGQAGLPSGVNGLKSPVSPEDLCRIISALQNFAASQYGTPTIIKEKVNLFDTSRKEKEKAKGNDLLEKEKKVDNKDLITVNDKEDTERKGGEVSDIESADSAESDTASGDEGVKSYSIPEGSTKNRADLIKRRLMGTPGTELPRTKYDDNVIDSPSRASTPNRSFGRSPSRSSSFSKPLCTADTKAGRPCRLPQKDGSPFCYKHQGNTSFME